MLAHRPAYILDVCWCVLHACIAYLCLCLLTDRLCRWQNRDRRLSFFPLVERYSSRLEHPLNSCLWQICRYNNVPASVWECICVWYAPCTWFLVCVTRREPHRPSFTSFFKQISLRCVRVLVLVCGALHLHLHFVHVLMLWYGWMCGHDDVSLTLIVYLYRKMIYSYSWPPAMMWTQLCWFPLGPFLTATMLFCMQSSPRACI